MVKPMNRFRVALLQLSPEKDNQLLNCLKGVRFCRLAKEMNADLALFPEMWDNGYSFRPMQNSSLEEILAHPDHPLRQEWAAKAIGSSDRFVTTFQDLARELRMAIVVTYLERFAPSPRNAAALINSSGDVVLRYAKVHTCDYELEGTCQAGEDFPTAIIEIDSGPVRIGVMICFDREFPEAARILMLHGAEIILTPNACEIEMHRKAQYATRAYENMVGVAMANYAKPDFNGHSLAFSPIAFDSEGRSLDTLIVEATEEEGVWYADFDMDAIRAYQSREVWGSKYRRPNLYNSLVQTQSELHAGRSKT